MTKINFVRIFLTVVGVFPLLFVVSACNLIRQNDASANQSNAAASEPATRPTRDPNAPKYFESVEEINRIKSAFVDKIGGEVKILHLNLGEAYAEIQAQDPKKPENVDEYTYRNGALEKVVPVKLSGPGKLEDNLFKLNDVALEKIPELVRDALERSKDLENPKSSLVRIELSNDGKIEIHANVSSDRKNAFLVSDAKGKFIEYRRY